MPTISFYTKPPSFSHEEFAQCVQWALKMESAVMEKTDPPMERPPPFYEVYRDHNPAAIDPVYAKTLQQQHHEIQNLQTIRELRGDAAPSNEVVSIRALEIVVDTIKDVSALHNLALNSTILALQNAGPEPSQARQRDNRRELHLEQRVGPAPRRGNPARREGNQGRTERSHRPEQPHDFVRRVNSQRRRSASPSCISKARTTASRQGPAPAGRSIRRPDTPYPCDHRRRENTEHHADRDYDGDQEMEDAFRIPTPPRRPPTRLGKPAQPAVTDARPAGPDAGDATGPVGLPVVAPTPVPFAAPGTGPSEAITHFFDPNISMPIPPFPRAMPRDPPVPTAMFQLPSHVTRPPVSDTASTADFGPEGASMLVSPATSHLNAFAALPMDAGESGYIHGIDDDFQGLALNPLDIVDQYIIAEPQLPLPI
ncbi:hypothetical protein AURDEDRAFT_129065 [Auricularia subglabra TFB-10046 SS5]|uniref:Uncharacterized protein n=1 Tax=Auricularia subglabra (strain TFB-10046 / SS5) TaxID=717982 RepID=J0DBN0_AURST|nr:hypothetical protein AURDEDRAFT_129065 [Auricularia subglabra TFB-10046 SS5]